MEKSWIEKNFLSYLGGNLCDFIGTYWLQVLGLIFDYPCNFIGTSNYWLQILELVFGDLYDESGNFNLLHRVIWGDLSGDFSITYWLALARINITSFRLTLDSCLSTTTHTVSHSLTTITTSPRMLGKNVNVVDYKILNEFNIDFFSICFYLSK